MNAHAIDGLHPTVALPYLAESHGRMDAACSMNESAKLMTVVCHIDADIGWRKFERMHRDTLANYTMVQEGRIEAIYMAAFWGYVVMKSTGVAA